MTDNNLDLMEENELSENSNGGTELIKRRLYDGKVPRELLEQFQIIASRVRDLDENKFRIFWAHDLPGDPESNVLGNNGWDKFHKIVFVSNWQMQAYINAYQIPWSKCTVIKHGIEPIPRIEKPEDYKIKLIYTPTPHRGLNILIPVFQKLCEKYGDIELDVYSSFKLYGFDDRDKEFEHLFEQCRDHPQINYHGSVSNDEVRAALQRADIFAYPSIWPETFCLSLLEAMSAGCLCVHSNYGCLYETAANWTYMYQLHEDSQMHAAILYAILDKAICEVRDKAPIIESLTSSQSAYVASFFNWEDKAKQWENLLSAIIAENPSKEIGQGNFSYRAG